MNFSPNGSYMYCSDKHILYSKHNDGSKYVPQFLGFTSDTKAWAFDLFEAGLRVKEINLEDNSEEVLFDFDLSGMVAISVEMMAQTDMHNVGISIVYRDDSSGFSYKSIVLLRYQNMMKVFHFDAVHGEKYSYAGHMLLAEHAHEILVFDVRNGKQIFEHHVIDAYSRWITTKAHLDPFFGRYLLLAKADSTVRPMIHWCRIDLFTEESFDIDFSYIWYKEEMFFGFAPYLLAVNDGRCFNLASCKFQEYNRPTTRFRSVNPPWSVDLAHGRPPYPHFVSRPTAVVRPHWVSCFVDLRKNTRELHMEKNRQRIVHKYTHDRRHGTYTYSKHVEGPTLVDRIEEWLKNV